MKILLRILGIVLAVLFVGDIISLAIEQRTDHPDVSPPTPYVTQTPAPREAPTAAISSFSYMYGSYFPGYCSFDVVCRDDGATLTVRGYNDFHDLYVETPVGENELAELNGLINELELYRWDGFSERDDGVLDGYSFTLRIEYADGDSVEADGYMRYPQGYGSAHDTLTEFFFTLSGVEDPFA